MVDRSEAEKHRSSVTTMLNSLRHERKLCDLTIMVENKKFLAHKNVLSASSDYFCSMFTSGFQEQEQDEISLELEGKSKNFESLLEFAYTGEMDVDIRDVLVADAIDMLNMAAYLQLKHAVKVITQMLLQAVESTDINPEEVFRIWTLADLLGKGMCMEDLAIIAMNSLARNFIRFSNVEAFKTDVTNDFLEKCLVKSNLAEFFSQGEEEKDEHSNDLLNEETRKEDKILDILISWLQHDWSHRKSYAFNLLRKIRLGFVSPDKVKNLQTTHIAEDAECEKLFAAVLERLISEDASKFSDLSDCVHARGVLTAPVLLDSNDNAIKFFDSTAGSWKFVKCFEDSPFMGLVKYSSVAIDGHLYVGGGMGGSEAMGTFCRYDIGETSHQLNLSNMENPRSDAAMVYMDNYIYAIGGVQSKIDRTETATLSVERYDINQVRYDSVVFEHRCSPWELVTPLPMDCWKPHAVAYEGKVLVCGLDRQVPVVPHLPRNIQIQVPEISYFLFMYDPQTNQWQQHHLEDRPMVTCMQGQMNYMVLLVHKGECYLIGNQEIDSANQPGTKWFRTTVNKLNFQELDNGSLRFQHIEEEERQDLIGPEYSGGFFYIGDDVFYKWRRCVCNVGVKTTDQNFNKVIALWNGGFANCYGQSFAPVTFDKDVVG